MTSDTIMTIFSVIILIYGLYALLSALKMKRTGTPSTILVSREELARLKSIPEFCAKLVRPTLLFGAMACLYGIIELLNEFVFRAGIIALVGVLCFVMVCLWFTRLVRDTKEEHLASRNIK